MEKRHSSAARDGNVVVDEVRLGRKQDGADPSLHLIAARIDKRIDRGNTSFHTLPLLGIRGGITGIVSAFVVDSPQRADGEAAPKKALGKEVAVYAFDPQDGPRP